MNILISLRTKETLVVFEKEIERKLQKDRKEKAQQAKRKKHKTPSYKGYAFCNWLVYPIGVLSVELELVQALQKVRRFGVV